MVRRRHLRLPLHGRGLEPLPGHAVTAADAIQFLLSAVAIGLGIGLFAALVS